LLLLLLLLGVWGVGVPAAKGPAQITPKESTENHVVLCEPARVVLSCCCCCCCCCWGCGGVWCARRQRSSSDHTERINRKRQTVSHLRVNQIRALFFERIELLLRLLQRRMRDREKERVRNRETEREREQKREMEIKNTPTCARTHTRT
jgi:hypothetical protein